MFKELVGNPKQRTGRKIMASPERRGKDLDSWMPKEKPKYFMCTFVCMCPCGCVPLYVCISSFLWFCMQLGHIYLCIFLLWWNTPNQNSGINLYSGINFKGWYWTGLPACPPKLLSYWHGKLGEWHWFSSRLVGGLSL